MKEQVYRLQYRGSLKKVYENGGTKKALEECQERIQRRMDEGRIMTAALYHYKQMLFFYYEAVGEKISPEELLKPLSSYLELWPGQDGLRLWVLMNQIYYHAVPEGKEDWKREPAPELRRGRIAFLKEDKWFSYVYHHTSIVEEGLLQGDKYHSIALHENILFSYFEEPKIMANVRKDLESESSVIKKWMEAVPEEHFLKLLEAEGQNFMFIPAYFAMG